MMKKIFVLLMALMLAVFMAACGGSKAEEKSETDTKTEEPAHEQEEADVEKEEIGEEQPSGVQDDGRGEDPSFGEGIGEVVALSDDEKAYVLAQTTNSWLALSQMEKDDLVVLMGRWLEESSGFIVEDYDDLVAMLDHQMEQYYRNSVDEDVLVTVCDICGIGLPDGVNEDGIGEEQPSGIQDDGRGEDPNFGEGIGEVVALTEEEHAYMLAQTTNSWLELSQMEKDELVVLIGRYLEGSTGFIVEDYDDLVAMLDHQMEQYYKNGVEEGVYTTVCDIFGLEA